MKEETSENINELVNSILNNSKNEIELNENLKKLSVEELEMLFSIQSAKIVDLRKKIMEMDD